MKRIRPFARYWIGTDALTLVMIPPGKWTWRFRIYGRRLFWRLFWKRFEHFAFSESKECPIVRHLVKFGIPRDRIRLHPGKVRYKLHPPKPHKGFNVLYYCGWGDGRNRKFKAWKYGWDVFLKVREYFSDWPLVGFVVVDGSQDLSEILPIVDCYIRPSRDDGAARLVRECQINGIPVYWSNNINVQAAAVVDFIKREINIKNLEIGGAG